MSVAIVSDAYVPDREESIPNAFRERIRAADHVVHAGDFTAPDVLAEVEDLAPDLTAVHGNVDREDIGLPTVATVDLGGVTFVVTHGTARSADAWLDTVADAVRREADEPRIGVGGHTHRVEDRIHEGVRLLNPGSVTGADPADGAMMMTAAVADGKVDVTVHKA